MKHNLWLLFSLFIMVSCGPPEFEKNTRVLVKGNLVDQNNNPLNNFAITVSTQRPTSLFSGEHYFILGSDFSQSDGSFAVTSLFDRDSDFSIEINGDDNYSKYVYATDTQDYLPENLTIDLQTVTLYQLSNLTYNINRTSAPGTTLSFRFTFQDTNCIEYFDEGVLNPIQSWCYQDTGIGRLLNDNSPDISRSFKSLLGSTVEFTYSINEGPEQTEAFILDQIDYEYNFSY